MLCFKESQIKVSAFLSQKILASSADPVEMVLYAALKANSADPDVMLPFAAFLLGPRWLPKCRPWWNIIANSADPDVLHFIWVLTDCQSTCLLVSRMKRAYIFSVKPQV